MEKFFKRIKKNEERNKTSQRLYKSMEKKSRNKKVIQTNKETIDTEPYFRKTTDTFSTFKTSINQSSIDNISSIRNNKKVMIKTNKKIEKNKFKKRIKDLVKEISRKRNKSETEIPSLINLKNKSIKLNQKLKIKSGKTNSIFFQKEEIIKNAFRENLRLQNKPKNNLELNNILINGFGLNGTVHPSSINYSKKLSEISEKYFNILELMKVNRTKLQLENFEKLKHASDNEANKKKSKDLMSNSQKDEIWIRKFFQKQYKDKITNEIFEKFKSNEILRYKKKIKENSERFTDLIFKLDCEPYEEKNEDENNYDSTREPISFRNLQRVLRLKAIQRSGKDYEENDYGLEINDKLRSESNDYEDMLTLSLEKLGPPKFLKTVFKTSTVRKFQTVSGNLFGS